MVTAPESKPLPKNDARKHAAPQPAPVERREEDRDDDRWARVPCTD
jgi:hypothetical protein